MELDPDVLEGVVKRLRRVQGQIGGVVRMIDEGRDCADVLIQLAAASRALNRASFKLVATGLRECALNPGAEPAGMPSAEELERLFLSLA